MSDPKPTTDIHDALVRNAPLVASPVDPMTLLQRWEKVLKAAPRILMVAVAAMVSYLVASKVTGQHSPFFAPIAAVVVLGATTGVRMRRAVQLALGVALGIAVADIFVSVIGTGAWQLAVIVFVCMCAVVFAGGDELAVRQAASAAILVSVLAIPGDPKGAIRFIDALIGSGVALVFNLLLFPVHPGRASAKAVIPAFKRLGDVLEHITRSLESRDLQVANEAIAEAIGLDAHLGEMREALDASGEAASLSVTHLDQKDTVNRYRTAMVHVARAQRNAVSLARGARRAIDLGDVVPQDVIDGLHSLAEAAREVGDSLGDRAKQESARRSAVSAAASATAALDVTRNLSVSMIVGQSRLIAKDLMVASGMQVSQARRDIRTAADEIPEHANQLTLDTDALDK